MAYAMVELIPPKEVRRALERKAITNTAPVVGREKTIPEKDNLILRKRDLADALTWGCIGFAPDPENSKATVSRSLVDIVDKYASALDSHSPWFSTTIMGCLVIPFVAARTWAVINHHYETKFVELL